MDIALLTLSASDNCGSLLQAYALQSVLSDQGHNVEILDFTTKKSKKMYRIFHPSYIRYPRKLTGIFLNYNKLKDQKNAYRDFRKKYLHMSVHQYRNSSDLAVIDGKYELVICGSDQVWNTDMEDFDDAYLLKWCNISKKAGYAVSLGDKKNNDLNELNKKHIKKDEFIAFSVREKAAQCSLKRFLGWNVELCLDPTLLLDYENWALMTDEHIVPETPYLFYYSYNYEDEIKNRMVAEFAEKMGLPVWVINISRWCDGRERKYGFHICKESGPIAFLSLIRYCQYVLVESFHGTIFSYIFKKQFFFLKNTDDNNLDDRINDIMEVLEIQNRVMHPNDILIKAMDTIDYEKEPVKLKALQELSFDFIASLNN